MNPQNPSPAYRLTEAEASEHLDWHGQNPVKGFQLYITTSITCVDLDTRANILNELDSIGWPLHLRSASTAGKKLIAGSPWAREDESPLLLLCNLFRLPLAVVANAFFEGRTVLEVDEKLRELTRLDPPTGYETATPVTSSSLTSPPANFDPTVKTPTTFLQQQRSLAIESLERAHADRSTRTKLKNALNKRGWPTRFTTDANLNAPPEDLNGRIWAPEDSQALVVFRNVAEKVPYTVLAEKFFVGRTEGAIRGHYQNLVKAGKAERMRDGA